MLKNDIVTLEITAITNEGNGVGRADGMAVFVPFSAKGDVLECRILKVMKTYAYAKTEKIISLSADRQDPDCESYFKCGGCVFRHMTYEAELEAKQGFVRDAFKRIGGLDIEFEPIISAGECDRYRNKAQLPVARLDGETVWGFYSQRSHRVAPCRDCKLSPKIFSDIASDITDYQKSRGLSCYDEHKHKGLLRHIYIRQGYHSGEIAVCLVVTENTDAYRELAGELVAKFPQIKSVLLNINPDKTNVILGKREILLCGSENIRDVICGVEVEISPKSFYQVNTAAAEVVYKKAAEYAALREGETLLDLYCGAGTVGLSMIKPGCRLIGVEAVPEAVENARKNAARNGVGNTEFIAKDAGEAAKMLAERGERPDVITVDPPRKGCDRATLDAIIKMSPKRVVMISCDPATAARDVKYLCQNGYAPVKACPADMFPRTAHVETVIKLSQQKPDGVISADLGFGER